MTRPILMVDDEKDLCDSLTRILKREFPTTDVRSTNDPIQAKQWLQQEPPAVFITDIRMPNISGLELISIASEIWGIIPTIVITAFTSPEYARMPKTSTFHYLPKPFRNQQLIRLVRQLIETQQPSPSLSAALADLVQLHAVTCYDGSIIVSTPSQGEVGKICFSKGRIIHAETQTSQGHEAFEQIHRWPNSTFRISPKSSSRETIHTPSSELITLAQTLSQQHAHESPKPIVSVKATKAPKNIDLVDAVPAYSVHNLEQCLARLKGISGLIGACIGEIEQERLLASLGNPAVPWKQTLPSLKKTLDSKQLLLRALSLDSSLEDIVMSTSSAFQVLRPSSRYPQIFFALVLDRKHSNLALARFTLAQVEQELILSSQP